MLAGRPEDVRLAALAASVLHDLDLCPADDGIVLTGDVRVEVSWADCREALCGADATEQVGRERLARWLLARRWIADHPLADLEERARPVGLPVGHLLHPGPEWVAERVLGGALDLGLGMSGLDPADRDAVVVVPPGVWARAGIDPRAWWSPAREYLDQMGAIAVDRWLRIPQAALRPMGDCDVATLLGSSALRHAIAGHNGGLASLAVPMRDRGWTSLRRIDPAFVIAAAAATDPQRRGFPRPLLVTSEEVAMTPIGGRPAELVLRDASPAEVSLPDVLYR